tara:strand:+ start:566 stop:1141 length:576 start_codon:yes stop_codon:yes gene_type:complete
MSKETLLKKEFKESDIQRVRNIVNKDFTASTKLQTGYRKVKKNYKEGDVWEESGKTWTIKDGIKQNITKLDGAKKALRIPLKCPKCKGSLEHWLAKKMYKIHGFCFDCTVDMEADLRKAGLYEDYERRMITGNIKEFVKDIENWVINSLDDKNSFVTEAGDVEDWGNMSNKAKKEILDNLKGYTDHIRKQL